MWRARVIYNPKSGKEQVTRHIPYILERLEQAGYEASCHATTSTAEDATREAYEAVKRQFDLVVAAGGDGTIHEVVNGLAPFRNPPRLGIIPMGTTNDLAVSIGVPRSIEAACDTICDGDIMSVDIGRANDRYFIYVAGGGKLTEISYDVPGKLKAVLGRLAYYVKGIELLPQVRPTDVRIEYDDQVFEGEIMLFLLANSHSVSGFEKAAPHASMNDGLFDMIVFKKMNIAQFIHIVQKVTRGEHVDDEHIIYKPVQQMKVTPNNKMQLNLDGEYGGLFPCDIVNLHECLPLCVPRDTAEKMHEMG